MRRSRRVLRRRRRFRRWSNVIVWFDVGYNKIGHLKNGFERPVIIHRAIFGSLERFIAILCEHTGGKWDFWISPRQLQIIPKGADSKEFAQLVHDMMILEGYSVSIDSSSDSLDKKVLNAQMDGFNFIGVIGPKEVKEETITLRKRDEKEQQMMKIGVMMEMFGNLRQAKKSSRRLAMEERIAKFKAHDESSEDQKIQLKAEEQFK